MSHLAVFRACLLPVLMRIGRVGIGIFALSMVLGALTPIPISFAAAHVPPRRTQIDATVKAFRVLSDTRALVLGTDRRLWDERGPFGTVPPRRTEVTAGARSFQLISDTEALAVDDEFSDLYLTRFTNGFWQTVETIDGDVRSFYALSARQIVVQGNDGKLWLENAPFGHVPPARTQIDANVATFQAIFATQILVKGNDNKLWLEHGPFGSAPPGRIQVDANVATFQALSTTEVAVLGTDGKLWLEFAPFG